MPVVVGNKNPCGHGQGGDIYSAESDSPSLCDQKQTAVNIMIREATAKGYAEATDGDSVNFGQPNSSTRRGRVGKGVANTLTCASEMGVVQGVRIRRLTPRECFRLQGWTDDYFEKAELINSDSQLYKQAGNGVTVNVIKAIAESISAAERAKTGQI